MRSLPETRLNVRPIDNGRNHQHEDDEDRETNDPVYVLEVRMLHQSYQDHTSLLHICRVKEL